MSLKCACSAFSNICPLPLHQSHMSYFDARQYLLLASWKQFYGTSVHTLFNDAVQSWNVKISYHYYCGHMESASGHVKSTKLEIMEEKPGDWI